MKKNPQSTIKEKLVALLKGNEVTLDTVGENSQQFKAVVNRREPSSLIFIREDGKIGFPTSNSIKFKAGDIVKGPIMADEESYFTVQVQEIV